MERSHTTSVPRVAVYNGWVRVPIFLLLCTLLAVVAANYDRAPTDLLKVGDVAPRTVKAPFTFTYQDFQAYEARRAEARKAVLPVYLHRAGLKIELATSVRKSFSEARLAVLGSEAQSILAEEDEERDARIQVRVEALSAEELATIRSQFVAELGVNIPDEEAAELLELGFLPAIENATVGLVEQTMERPIIGNAQDLPEAKQPITLIELQGLGRAENILPDPGEVLGLDGARQFISINALELKSSLGDERYVDLSATIARGLVRPNMTFESLETEERRRAAEAAEPLQSQAVKRGTIIFRQGDVLTEKDLLEYEALRSFKMQHPLWMEILSIGVFIFFLLGTLYHFGSSYFRHFHTRTTDIVAVGILLLLTMTLARLTVAGSEAISLMIGFEAEASSVWFVVPVAGAAMLVRLLLGVPWTVMFAVAAAGLCGLVMELRALHVIFFIVSSLVAAGAVESARERRSVLSAGFFTGVINAAAVLLIHLVQLFIADADVDLATSTRPLWSIVFAFSGGVLSGMLALGLVPLFEAMGFVTDYRLMELANLNHPLLRKLMLRAPGSYHHSVLVGTLGEAACEGIGANALQAKVAAYFHDIGKSEEPQYFIENQRDGVNKHSQLDPRTSAEVIINHVIAGGQMAKEHGLPKPIVDNIYMHHGDGILQYFYAKACEEEGDVDEADFRYPGPKPNTREAGVVMLADKVEAATRTIRQPNEENIRSMINHIINSVISDGQFSECPLTFKELHSIADTFVSVLLGIYHQRIEYPQSRAVSRSHAVEEPTESAVITLELSSARNRANSGSSAPRTESPEGGRNPDYESVEHLPSGQG
jgi:cyclic-di-AMP phosphodiesterase PgpH